MQIPKAREICCLPTCDRPRWGALRCGIHSQQLKRENFPEWERIHQLIKDDRAAAEHLAYVTKNPPLPKWEYAGQEYILIRRQRWLDEHPNAPTLMTWEEVDDEIEKENAHECRRDQSDESL